MTAQPVDAEPQHGTLTGYGWHYSRQIPVCQACRNAASRYQRAQRAAQRRQRDEGRVTVVPVGWPCKDCEWSERFTTSDGRLISWRLECCPKHQWAW